MYICKVLSILFDIQIFKGFSYCAANPKNEEKSSEDNVDIHNIKKIPFTKSTPISEEYEVLDVTLGYGSFSQVRTYSYIILFFDFLLFFAHLA